MPKNICAGQWIHESKYAEAKTLRRWMTRAERLLWGKIRNNQLENIHFRRQQIVAGFIVDFYCHQASLVVELDGAVHLHNKEADFERDTLLKGMGFRIIHFTNEEVLSNMNLVLGKILDMCASDLTPPSPAPPPPLPLREGEEGDGGRRG
ncbi:MAG: endonuclease domain-containing protein [Anaerolineales bacterium]|nr:endonuclease domain-containing protein [Anaerolineales bacterium]